MFSKTLALKTQGIMIGKDTFVLCQSFMFFSLPSLCLWFSFNCFNPCVSHIRNNLMMQCSTVSQLFYGVLFYFSSLLFFNVFFPFTLLYTNLPLSVLGQAGCGFEQPDLEKCVPANDTGGETRKSFKSYPIQTIL